MTYRNKFLNTTVKMKKNKCEQTSVKSGLNIIRCDHKWTNEQLQKKLINKNEEAVWALIWNNHQEILLSDEKIRYKTM